MRQYTQYSQNDPKWANDLLGSSNVTIGNDGCYVDSFAVCATYFGHIITPKELNQVLTQKKLYVDGDYIGGDNTLSQVFPDIQYVDHYLYPDPSPADLGKLQALLNDETLFVILEIELRNANGTVAWNHFTPALSCDGNVVMIMNAWNGFIENFTQNYGDPKTNIVKYVVYKGQPKTDNPNMYKGLDLTNTASVKAAIDTWSDVVHGEYYPKAEVDNAHKLIYQALDLPFGASIDDVIKQIVFYKNKPPQIIIKTPVVPQVDPGTLVAATPNVPVTEKPSNPSSLAPGIQQQANTLPTQTKPQAASVQPTQSLLLKALQFIQSLLG